jgi:preprotein translocase subunit YajC
MTFNLLQAVQTEQPAENQISASTEQQASPQTTNQTSPVENPQMTTKTEVPPQTEQAENQPNSMMPMIIMLVAMFVIMYFFMIRPQKKRQKQIQEMRSQLQIGSEVILASGIRGKVKDTNPEKSYMTIEISKGVYIDVDRNCVYTDIEQTMQR